MEEKNFEPLRLCFEKHCWDWQDSEEMRKNIQVHNKGNMWLYNYNDGHQVERTHPVLMKCRGLVIREDGCLLNYPFERFFNDFEKEHVDIDWDSAEIQEKLDGSLVCVFWNGEGWEITTRGMFYPSDAASLDFAELFREYFKSFGWMKREFCYMFELVTARNRIIKFYDEEGVYLVGVRRLDDCMEVGQDILDKMAKLFRVSRPKKYVAKNFEQCRELFEKFNEDDEGLVVVDKNFNRVKVKQESYFRLVKISMLNEQHIFECVLGLTEIDSELLDRLPEVREKAMEIEDCWERILATITEVYERISDIKDRKEFALEAIKHPFKGILFSIRDGDDYLTRLRWDSVRKWENFKDEK